MDFASLYCLGIPVLLFLTLLVIGLRTYAPSRKEKGEEPKYRMMQDD